MISNSRPANRPASRRMTLSCGSTLIATLLLFGCGGGDESGMEGGGGEDSGTEGMAEMSEISVEIAGIGDDPTEGSVTFVPDGDSYTVRVEIDTHRGPGDYPIMIHAGTCAAYGDMVANLRAIEGQEGGEGAASNTVAASTLMGATPFSVLVMTAQGAAPIGCADVPSL